MNAHLFNACKLMDAQVTRRIVHKACERGPPLLGRSSVWLHRV